MSAENILSAYVQADMNCDKIIQIYPMKICKEPHTGTKLSQAKGMAKTQEQGFSENGNISHKTFTHNLHGRTITSSKQNSNLFPTNCLKSLWHWHDTHRHILRNENTTNGPPMSDAIEQPAKHTKSTTVLVQPLYHSTHQPERSRNKLLRQS
jgi:hypothetical protein